MLQFFVYLQIPKIERLMSVLSSIITVAPILGLTGTVLGLMDIFNVISGGGIGDASLLSSGIAEALINQFSSKSRNINNTVNKFIMEK